MVIRLGIIIVSPLLPLLRFLNRPVCSFVRPSIRPPTVLARRVWAVSCTLITYFFFPAYTRRATDARARTLAIHHIGKSEAFRERKRAHTRTDGRARARSLVRQPSSPLHLAMLPPPRDRHHRGLYPHLTQLPHHTHPFATRISVCACEEVARQREEDGRACVSRVCVR